MPLLFTGTSTGNLYEVGRSYSGSRGDTYTANADGSFTNQRSGRTEVGSSQDSSVSWFSRGADGSLSSPDFYTDAGKPIFSRADSGGGSGPASRQVNNGVSGSGSAGGSGAGSAVVTTAGPRSGGSGPGSALAISAPLPLGEVTPLQPIYAGGRRIAIDMGWSNAGDAEERWGDTEFLSPSWFYTWGVAGADTWANLDHERGGPLRTDNIARDWNNLPGWLGQGAAAIGQGFLENRAAGRDPFGPDHRTPGFTTGGF